MRQVITGPGWLAILAGSCALAQAASTSRLPAALQQQFEQVMQAHAADPAVQAFGQRLALVDEVEKSLNQNFDRFRSAALHQLLDDSLGAPGPKRAATAPPPVKGKAPPPATTAAGAATALDLLAVYGPRFAAALPLPAIPPDQQQVLREYYSAYLRAAGAHIAERGRTAIAANPKDTFHLVGLSLVLPMLHTPDEAWSKRDIDALPAWIRQPAVLQQVESVSLAAMRPLTAMQFADTLKPRSEASDIAPARLNYLRTTADRMLREGRHLSGVACLRTALAITRETGTPEEVAALHLRLGEVLNDTQQPAAAAEEMAALLAANPPEATWAKAAMLRLKYLYEAERFTDVLSESAAHQKDPRCAEYLPQMLYITWVAARRADNATAAQQTRTVMLKQFPDHPLAADVYFAHAMEALAASDYDEAGRVLEFIEFRFPKSRLMPKVKQIQERLRSQTAKP